MDGFFLSKSFVTVSKFHRVWQRLQWQRSSGKPKYRSSSSISEAGKKSRSRKVHRSTFSLCIPARNTLIRARAMPKSGVWLAPPPPAIPITTLETQRGSLHFFCCQGEDKRCIVAMDRPNGGTAANGNVCQWNFVRDVPS